jgi:hypothetical protein
VRAGQEGDEVNSMSPTSWCGPRASCHDERKMKWNCLLLDHS